jgi:hypothetical protein
MGARRSIATRLRYTANSYATPIWIARILEAVAGRIYPHTALTCKHCGERIEYRGDVYAQAELAYEHSESHYSQEGPINV